MAEALYRKYRPQIFEDVVGQEPIERTIKNAVSRDKVSHAYLFCGPRGTGKTTTARLLAKALLCERGPTPDPDGTCEDCRLIAEGAHPDVYELDAASRTGVENVREEIISRVQFAPTRGRYKVYIIDEVHMLSTAAFNALLKTLEEPPAHVVFVLCTTDPQKVPETIQSRCQRFDFRRIAPESIVSRLGAICVSEDVEFEGEALDLIAHRAEGGMRNALTSLEQIIAFGNGTVTLKNAERILGAVDSNDMARIISYVGKRDVASCFRWTADYMETGADLAQFTRDMAEHVRNMYVLSVAGADVELDVTETERRELVEELRWFGPDRLARLLSVLGDLMTDLKTSSDQRLSFEIALTRMVRPDSDLTLESLAERVEALEANRSAVAHIVSDAPAQAPAMGQGAGAAAGFSGASNGRGAMPQPMNQMGAQQQPQAQPQRGQQQGARPGSARAAAQAALERVRARERQEQERAAAQQRGPAEQNPQAQQQPRRGQQGQYRQNPQMQDGQLQGNAGASAQGRPQGRGQYPQPGKQQGQGPTPAQQQAAQREQAAQVQERAERVRAEAARAQAQVAQAQVAQAQADQARAQAQAAQQVNAQAQAAAAPMGAAQAQEAGFQDAAAQSASTGALSAELAATLGNPAALQRVWQATLSAVKKQKSAFGVLFMNTKVSFDAGRGAVVVSFPPENEFAFRAVQKPEVQQALDTALAHAAGAPVPAMIVQGQGAAASQASAPMQQAQRAQQQTAQQQPTQQSAPMSEARLHAQRAKEQVARRAKEQAARNAAAQNAAAQNQQPVPDTTSSASPQMPEHPIEYEATFEDQPPYDEVPYDDVVPYDDAPYDDGYGYDDVPAGAGAPAQASGGFAGNAGRGGAGMRGASRSAGGNGAGRAFAASQAAGANAAAAGANFADGMRGINAAAGAGSASFAAGGSAATQVAGGNPVSPAAGRNPAGPAAGGNLASAAGAASASSSSGAAANAGANPQLGSAEAGAATEEASDLEDLLKAGFGDGITFEQIE